MSRDFYWCEHRHGITFRYHIRLFWERPKWILWNIWNGLKRWLRGEKVWDFDLDLKTSRGNTQCYCDGSMTDFSVRLFGIGFWTWCSRDKVKRPCICDKICWLASPESHWDDAVDYGLDRLRAEFAGDKWALEAIDIMQQGSGVV